MSTRFNFENHPGYEKLKEAFRLSNKDFLGSIELVPEENVCFSPRYEKKMVRLIKRQKRPYWKYVNTVGKKIAVIAIAFMMLFGLSMTIKAVREPVVSFIVTVFDKFSELFVDKSETQNAPDKIEEVYTLTDLPEGYLETFFDNSEKTVEFQWRNEENIIVFQQNILKSKTTFDIEDSNVSKYYKNGCEIFYISKNNTTKIFWRTNFYSFEIEINKMMNEDEMTVLFESVKIK